LKLTSLQSKANQPKPTTKATTKTAGWVTWLGCVGAVKRGCWSFIKGKD
jgi:hypothetical protein